MALISGEDIMKEHRGGRLQGIPGAGNLDILRWLKQLHLLLSLCNSREQTNALLHGHQSVDGPHRYEDLIRFMACLLSHL